MRPRVRSWYFWIFLFVVINVLFPQKGNPNPASRLAAMAAFCETGSFAIDAYVGGPLGWTNDWSRSPNGHSYSNKPPAPMLIGLPVFWLVDQWIVAGLASPQDRFLKRRQSLPIYNRWVSILFQVIPFAILAALVLRRLEKESLMPASIHFAALAILFGNTASLLMNTYFGHGMAAMFLLGLMLSLEEDHWRWAGFSAGCAALCDYSAIIVFGMLPLVTLAKRENWRQRWKDSGIGSVIPLAIGGLYFTACFGRPWRLPSQYESPEFLDVPTQSSVLWGLFNKLPNTHNLLKLLLGSERGLLFTQPWLLITVTAGLFFLLFRKGGSRWQRSPLAFVLFTFSLGSLLLMNASFGGWHGGRTIGPRYLCALFPALAYFAAFVYEDFSPAGRTFLWGLLALSLMLCALVVSTTLFVPPGVPLWPTLCATLRDSGVQAHLRFAATLLGIAGGGIWICRRSIISP